MKTIYEKNKNQKYNIDVESFFWLPGNINIFWKDLKGTHQGCNDILAKIHKGSVEI